MTAQDPLKAEKLERVDPEETERTEERDAAADWIEAEVIAKGRWPMTLTDMDEESRWSRQHLRNTLNAYYTPADSTQSGVDVDDLDALPQAIPGRERELMQAYRMGYRDGRRDAERD